MNLSFRLWPFGMFLIISRPELRPELHGLESACDEILTTVPRDLL